jgi:phosphoribosylformylglycinamidine synthase
MATPKVMVMSGYGLNCETETKAAFDKAGAQADIVHINDLIEGLSSFDGYQIIAFPGGFSYGDDTGSGLAYANRFKLNLFEKFKRFMEQDKLGIGICNGFQSMGNLGLVPALNGHNNVQVALTHNNSARYKDRWVDLEFHSSSPWTKGIRHLSLPIAHGEGRFYAEPGTLWRMQERGLIAAKYVSGDMCAYQGLEANPNGSVDDIAAITDETGRFLGMMPHPERAINFTHRPDWPLLKENLRKEGKELPEEGASMKLFRNAVKYFG